MDFSRLAKWEAIGALGALLGAITLFLLPWYSLSQTVAGRPRDPAGPWICGAGNFHCTGWETFPTLRWVLIIFGIAPLVLAWIVVRGHKLSYPPGEITMTVGMTGFVLIAYNGLLDKPGSGDAEIGVTLAFGYFVALVVGVLITIAGFMRSEQGQRKQRKAPGTV